MNLKKNFFGERRGRGWVENFLELFGNIFWQILLVTILQKLIQNLELREREIY